MTENELFEEERNFARRHGVAVQLGLCLFPGQSSDPGCPGLFMAIANLPQFPVPLGTVWYTHGPGRISLEHSYVIEWARRLGVRQAIHNSMLERYPGVLEFETGRARSEASRAFLLKNGFVQTGDRWVLRRKGAGEEPAGPLTQPTVEGRDG